MKSKTSLFNKAVFKRNLTGCFGLWAGFSVLYLLMLPVSIYSSMAGIARYTEPDRLMEMRMYNMLSWIWQMKLFVFIFAAAALITAMFLFSYLFTARNSNMMHTYPVNRMSLFTTNYLCGLLFLLVPLLISALLALLVGAAFGVATGEIVKNYLVWMAAVTVENIFFFSLSVCVLMFVGNIIAVPVLYGILNVLYMGIMMTAEWMVNAVCYGIETFYIYTPVPLGKIMTPVYCLANLELYQGMGENWKAEYSTEGAEILLIYFVAAAVFVVIAVAAYQKKHVETAGDVITVKWLKPVFRWGAAVCTSAVGAIAASSILVWESFRVILASVIIIGIIVFFIAQMVLDRSVHVFSKKRIRECLVYTVLVSLIYIGLDSDVLGMERKIPQASDVKVVWVSGQVELYAEDASEIAWAEDIHKQIIESKKNFERAENYVGEDGMPAWTYIGFDYEMKDGSKLQRNYRIPNDRTPGSVRSQIQEYADRPDVILRRYFGVHYPDVEIFGGIWEGESRYSDSSMRISEESAKRFYQAVVKDAQAGNLSKEEDGSTVYYGYLILDVRDESGFISPQYPSSAVWTDEEDKTEIYVNSNFQNLVKEMKKAGYIPDKEDHDTES